MVMLGVPERVIGNTGRKWIELSIKLSGLFTEVPEDAVGAPHIVIARLRCELESTLSQGLFEYLRFVEQNERLGLSLDYRPSEFFLGREESVRVLGASLYEETPTEVMGRILQSLVDLSLLTRLIYLEIQPVRGSLRRYLWSQYRVVDQAFRELLRCDFVPFCPNAKTGRKVPEDVLQSLAEVIVHERSILPGFVNQVRHDAFAHDALTGLKRMPILDLNGRAGLFNRRLSVSNVVDVLASSHPRHRRALLSSVLEDMLRIDNMEFEARIRMSRGERSLEIRMASDVMGVQLHMLTRALRGYLE